MKIAQARCLLTYTNPRNAQVLYSRNRETSLKAKTNSRIDTPAELRIAEWTGTVSQQRALKDLNKRLEKTSNQIDPETVLWFLRDRNFDPVEAEEKLLKTTKWKEAIGWDTLSPEQFSKEYSLGKVKIHDHPDLLGRPVILLDTSKHKIGQFPRESTEKLCAFAVKEALRLLPEDKDTFLTVFDLREFGTANADLSFVKYMIDLFFVYNPKRVGQSLLVEAPWVFKPVWQFVKPLLRKYAALVRFVNVEDLRTEYFDDNTIPVEFKK